MSPTDKSLLPPAETLSFVQKKWQGDVLPTLTRYIEIPAKSPAFDAEWAAHGHIDRAVSLIEEWGRARPIEGLTVETFRLPGRTPVMLLDVPGTSPETVLLYGHCDKQPEMIGLGRWARAVDAGPARRPALRPRRPGRRLRGLLRPHRDRGGPARRRRRTRAASC